jgi:hypothetical protein
LLEGETARVTEAATIPAPSDLAPGGVAPRKLTHHQARLEQHLYWSRKSIPERLAAATALTTRMYRMRGIHITEQETDFTPRRARRRQG